MTASHPDPRARLASARLYLVTPADPPAGRLDRLLPALFDAGVDIVQLREKHMEARPLIAAAEIVRRRAWEAEALFIVNDRVDVAIAAGADGVHLGQNDLPTHEARRQMGPGALIGLSTHSEDQILASATSAADYIAVGPVHATPTKPGRPAVGNALVRFAVASSSRPFFAIGGIGPSTLPETIAGGARRVAVVRAVTEAEDPVEAARTMRALLDEAWRAEYA